MWIIDDLKEKIWFKKSPEKLVADASKTPDQKMDKLVPEIKKNLAWKVEWNSTKEQLRSLERERNRISKFNSIKSLENVKDVEIKDEENIDNISAKKLLKIEKENIWFLSSAFAYKQTIDKDWNIQETPLEQKDVLEWDKILIDFWKNSWANWKVWAWDIIPENIKAVKIKDINWNERVWIRWVKWNKVGYYDENWYIPIFNWYMIEVPTKAESEKILLSTSWKIKLDEKNENDAKKEFIDDCWKREEWESMTWTLKQKKDGIEFNKFRLDNSEFQEIAKNIWVSSEDIWKIQSIMSAIWKQESSSDYWALWQILPSWTHIWTRALWRYQIMPKNWTIWSREHFWNTIWILDFTPENQDRIAFAQIATYYKKYQSRGYDFNRIIEEISKDWYWRWNPVIWGHPSTESYAKSVQKIYENNFA